MPPVVIFDSSLDGIKSMINKNDFVIFSLSNCPFCTNIKQFFNKKQINFTLIEIDQQSNSSEIRSNLFLLTGQRTFPNIFAFSNQIGGCDDVLTLDKNGNFENTIQVYKKRKELEKSSATFDYDAVIIGGGSGGIAFAKEYANAGKKVALFDYVVPSPMGTTWGLGGTCVNVGCIPKKLMHQASIIGDNLVKSQFYGFKQDADMSHDWHKMITNIDNYIRSLNFAYRSELMSKDVEYINALASISSPHHVSYVDSHNETKSVSCKYIVAATGERPDYPNIGGKQFCISSDDLFWLKYPPGETIIIGASYVALESAGALHGMGYPVTVIVRSIFLRGYDQEMAEKIGAFMEEKGIKIYRPAVPIDIECIEPIDIPNRKPGRLRVRFKMTYDNGAEDKIITRECNTVMVAIGRVSCTSNIGLDVLGISLDARKRVISIDDREQTIVENVFAVGDILAGKPQLTPVAIKAGQLLAKRLSAQSYENTQYNIVPTTVFTPLEYGAIGLSEEDAIAKYGNDDIDVYYNYCEPLEEKIIPNTDHGAFYAKLICRKSQIDKVVGLHILSPNAGEIVQGYAVAFRMGATLTDFNLTFGIHPTVSEVFTNLKFAKGSGKEAVTGGC